VLVERGADPSSNGRMAVDEFHERFGQRLRYFRRRLGLSQEALGARIPMSADAIGLSERGLNGPRLATVVKIAKALEVRPFELISFSEDTRASRVRTAALHHLETQLLSVDEDDLTKVVEVVELFVEAYRSGRGKS
jgi:transcriptional regulator with XRE-family HTH domain